MSAPWFHLDQPLAAGDEVQLDAVQGRHAAGVRRLDIGDVVSVFDGRGAVGRGVIDSTGSKREPMRITLKEIALQPAPRPVVHVAAALPKGDRQSTMLSMLTQIGATRFTPLACRRSAVIATENWRPRAQRIVIESCKQARRAHLMELGQAESFGEAIARCTASGACVLIAHPDGAALRTVLYEESISSSSDLPIAVFVGPEGGFTDEEVSFAVDVAPEVSSTVSLGPCIQRIETAAVSLTSAVMLLLGGR